jgi:alpha-D-xyloside xylohydrolase
MPSHSRLHGSRSYRVPWDYDAEAVAVTRDSTRLKHRLMPHLFDAARQAADRGWPVMPAMLLEFPDDPACHTVDRQYMLGGDLLVAPVFAADGMVEYYVPAGTWTHCCPVGGSRARVGGARVTGSTGRCWPAPVRWCRSGIRTTLPRTTGPAGSPCAPTPCPTGGGRLSASPAPRGGPDPVFRVGRTADVITVEAGSRRTELLRPRRVEPSGSGCPPHRGRRPYRPAGGPRSRVIP